MNIFNLKNQKNLLFPPLKFPPIFLSKKNRKIGKIISEKKDFRFFGNRAGGSADHDFFYVRPNKNISEK